MGTTVQEVVLDERTGAEPVSADGGRTAKVLRSVWLWPTLIAAVLGGWHLTRPEMWRDELATWDAATRTTGQLWALLHHTDASSGTYFFAMHVWVAVFGDSVVSLRTPSLLAMAAAAAVTAQTAKRMFGHRAGLAAGIVFAVLPAVSRYAQEARSYALTVFAVALATLLLVRALDRPGWRRWSGYALAVALVGASNLVALAMLTGHAAVVAAHSWRERDRRVMIGFPSAAVLGAALVSPVAMIGLRQVGSQISWIPKPDLVTLSGILPQLFCSALVAGAVIVASALTFGAVRRQALHGVAIVVLPLAAIWLVSYGQISYWLPRYLLFTLPAWAVIAGAGIAALRPAATIAGVVVLALLGLPDQVAVRAPGAHDWDNFPSAPIFSPFSYSGAAAVITRGYRPGDGLVPVRDVRPYYFIDIGLRYNLPADVRPRDVFAAHTGIELSDFFTIDTTDPKAALGPERRLWLVTVGNPADPLQGMAPDKVKLLRDQFTVTRIVYPSGFTTVALLERKAGKP